MDGFRDLDEHLHTRKYGVIRRFHRYSAPPGWLSGGCEFDPRLRRLFFPGVFSPLTSAEACDKSSRWLWEKKSCVSTGLRKPGNTFASPTAMI